VSTYVITPYNRKGYVLVFNSLHDGETPLRECIARHDLESNDAFDYILRSITFRPHVSSSSSSSSPPPLPPGWPFHHESLMPTHD
jgi:hypothetical protein